MKWVLWICGGLVLLVGLVATIGAMLPKAHSATRRARYRVSPEALYAVLSGPPDWRTGIKSFGVLRNRTGSSAGGKKIPTGRRSRSNWWKPAAPKRLARAHRRRGPPFGGTWTFDIAQSWAAARSCDRRGRRDLQRRLPFHGAFFLRIHRQYRRVFAGPGRQVRSTAEHRGLPWDRNANAAPGWASRPFPVRLISRPITSFSAGSSASKSC